MKISEFMFTAWSEIKYLATKEPLSLVLTTKQRKKERKLGTRNRDR